jgi:hypothetical protein
MSRQKSALTGVSGVDTVIAGGMPASFARPAATRSNSSRRCRCRAN